jgi:hypothetical protein
VSSTSIRLLPVVAGGNEVVGAVMVGAEDDDADDDDVPEAVVSFVAAAAPFWVKSIVRRTGWHISTAPTVIADAHKSKLLTLAGIVVLIGSMIGASFPRRTVTSMPMFLVERLLLVAADVVVAVASVVSLCVGLDGVVVGDDDGDGTVEVSVLGGMAVFEVTPPPLSPIFNVNVSGLVTSGRVVVLIVVPVLSPSVNV